MTEQIDPKEFQQSKIDNFDPMEAIYKAKQEFEDMLMKHEIEREAHKMFFEWQKAPILKIRDKEFKNFMYVPHFSPIYNIHHEKSAKYLNVDSHKLLTGRFQQLKSEYEQSELDIKN